MILRLIVILSVLWTASSMAWAQPVELRQQQRLDRSPYLNLSFTSLLFSDYSTDGDSGNRLTSYNYVTLARMLSPRLRFTLVTPFAYNTSGFDGFDSSQPQDEELILDDVYLTLERDNLGYLFGAMPVAWQLRLYFPTSPISRESDQIGSFRNSFHVTASLGRGVSLTYTNKFQYWHQSRSAYLNRATDSEGFLREQILPTNFFSLYNGLNLLAELDSEWAIGAEIYALDTIFNQSQLNELQPQAQHILQYGPQVQYKLTDSVQFLAVVYDTIDERNTPNEFGRFNSDNIQFFFQTHILFN